MLNSLLTLCGDVRGSGNEMQDANDNLKFQEKEAVVVSFDPANSKPTTYHVRFEPYNQVPKISKGRSLELLGRSSKEI